MTATKSTKYSKVTASGDVEEDTSLSFRKGRKSMRVPPQYLDLGMYLAAPLLIAVFVGRYLDERFQTKALFTIGLLVFGTISVFYNLIRLYKKDDSISN